MLTPKISKDEIAEKISTFNTLNVFVKEDQITDDIETEFNDVYTTLHADGDESEEFDPYDESNDGQEYTKFLDLCDTIAGKIPEALGENTLEGGFMNPEEFFGHLGAMGKFTNEDFGGKPSYTEKISISVQPGKDFEGIKLKFDESDIDCMLTATDDHAGYIIRYPKSEDKKIRKLLNSIPYESTILYEAANTGFTEDEKKKIADEYETMRYDCDTEELINKLAEKYAYGDAWMIRAVMKEKNIRESAGDNTEIVQIFVDGFPYYLTKIDTTHYNMVNNKDVVGTSSGMSVHHIGEAQGSPYYDDIKTWLKGGASPEGKSYTTKGVNEETIYRVVWTDREYKDHSKDFKDDPDGAPENGKVKAQKYLDKLSKKDKESSYGLYRNLDLKIINEGTLYVRNRTDADPQPLKIHVNGSDYDKVYAYLKQQDNSWSLWTVKDSDKISGGKYLDIDTPDIEKAKKEIKELSNDAVFEKMEARIPIMELLKLAKQVAISNGLDLTKYDEKQIEVGLDVESEHGSKFPQLNITGDDLLTTLKITLAHLEENPQYYTLLAKHVESQNVIKEDKNPKLFPYRYKGTADQLFADIKTLNGITNDSDITKSTNGEVIEYYDKDGDQKLGTFNPSGKSIIWKEMSVVTEGINLDGLKKNIKPYISSVVDTDGKIKTIDDFISTEKGDLGTTTSIRIPLTALTNVNDGMTVLDLVSKYKGVEAWIGGGKLNVQVTEGKKPKAKNLNESKNNDKVDEGFAIRDIDGNIIEPLDSVTVVDPALISIPVNVGYMVVAVKNDPAYDLSKFVDDTDIALFGNGSTYYVKGGSVKIAKKFNEAKLSLPSIQLKRNHTYLFDAKQHAADNKMKYDGLPVTVAYEGMDFASNFAFMVCEGDRFGVKSTLDQSEVKKYIRFNIYEHTLDSLPMPLPEADEPNGQKLIGKIVTRRKTEGGMEYKYQIESYSDEYGYWLRCLNGADDATATSRDLVGTMAKYKMVDVNEASDTYFDTMNQAIEAAKKYATDKGYEVVDDNVMWDAVNYETTVSKSLGLKKDGKEQRKMLHISFYRMPSGKYELTCYIN